MKIYVVTGHYDYEGGKVLGVFSKDASAITFAKNIQNNGHKTSFGVCYFDNVYIEPFTLITL